MAVNLSRQQLFDPDLGDHISRTLEKTGMAAQLLELEIPESVLISDIPGSLAVLNDLKGLGVRIVIDDFGVGYSTLSLLQKFPLDSVKIDRTFFRDVAVNPQRTELTDAIVSMGKSLSMSISAQGVETREQAEFLRRHACDEVQGFYFSEPLEAGKFASLLGAGE